jgi:hypothetical protein
VRDAAEFTVKANELELLMVPVSDTWYNPGAVPAGTWNPTRRILLVIVITLIGLNETAVPPPVGVKVIVTPPGAMDPLGNPLPVRVTFVTAACPEFGEMAVNVTL